MLKFLFDFFFLIFCGDKSPFCGVARILCFRLWLTLPMGFKVRVDPSLLVLYCHLYIMILRVNSEFSGPGLIPILHLVMVRLPLEWLLIVTSRMAGRFKPIFLDCQSIQPFYFNVCGDIGRSIKLNANDPIDYTMSNRDGSDTSRATCYLHDIL